MKYSKDQFIWEVTNEVVLLRERATKEELENLSLALLDPIGQERCIYGMATGDCFSQRATELIMACCPRYFHDGAVNRRSVIGDIVNNVNGIDPIEFKNKRSNGWFSKPLFSSIEAYITLPEANNANLIAYLRSETDTLDLYF